MVPSIRSTARASIPDHEIKRREHDTPKKRDSIKPSTSEKRKKNFDQYLDQRIYREVQLNYGFINVLF